MSPPTAVIVTIGDELLNGDRLDSNARTLARFLSDEGFEVIRAISVGDEAASIGEAMAEGAARASLVVSTGGLGPTLDDRTREGVAERWGLRLIEDPTVLEELERRFRERGYHELPRTNRRVARVPEGAGTLSNGHGTAPAIHLEVPGAGENDRTLLLLLPGVPREMEGFLRGEGGHLLRTRFGGRVQRLERRVFHTTGIPESALAGRVEAHLAGVEGVRVAYRPSLRGVELVLSAGGENASERLSAACGRVGEFLEPFVYDDPQGDLAGALGRALLERQLRIAVAESCTGGLILGRLTGVPGSSEWVAGGVVAYANRIKVDALGVSEALLDAQGAVSEGVARAMAEGVRTRMGVEIGAAVTGIAGPGGSVEGKPVGTVWFAVSGPRGTHAERLLLPGGRAEVRERAVQHLLHLVFRSVLAPGRESRPGADDPSEHEAGMS